MKRRLVGALLVASLLLVAFPHLTSSSVSTNVLGRHVTAKLVEGSSPNQPIVVSSTFFTTDSAVLSWVQFLNLTSPSHLVKWSWFDPSGSLYLSQNTTLGDPGAGKTIPSVGAWAGNPISGYAASNKTGTWQVKIYFDGALVATDTFKIIMPPWGVTSFGIIGDGAHGIAVDPVTNVVYTVGGSDTGKFCVTVGGSTSCVFGGYLRASDGKNLSQILKIISGTLEPPVFGGSGCGPFQGWDTLRLIHGSAGGPLDVVAFDSIGGCVWDYLNPFNQSNLVFNPDNTWVDLQPVKCAQSSGGCTAIDTGTPVTAGGKSRLFYGVGSYICEIHAVSCLNNFGAAYNGGPFAFDSANNMIYAVGTSSNLLVINTTNWALVTTIPLPSFINCFPSCYVAVNPITNRIYASVSATGNGGLWVVDGKTNSLIARLKSPEGQVALDTVNNLIYTYDWPIGYLDVIDGRSNTIIAQVPVTDQSGCKSGSINNLAVNSQVGILYLTQGTRLCAITSLVAPAASFGQVVINEVALNPTPGIWTAGKNSTQWVELHNTGTSQVDIGGWTLTPLCAASHFPNECHTYNNFFLDSNPRAASIPEGTKIAPGGYYVYETASKGFDSWLGTANQTLVLRDASGRIVDWTPPLSDPNDNLLGYLSFGIPASVQTWQRYPDGVNTHSIADWRLLLPTKGSQNLNTTVSKLQVGQGTFPVTIASNSTVSTPSFNQAQNQLSIQISGPSNTRGIIRIGFPNTLLTGTITVQFDGSVIQPKSLDRNATYTQITVTYSHSSHTITVTGMAPLITTSTTASTTATTSSASLASTSISTSQSSTVTSSSTQQSSSSSSPAAFYIPSTSQIGDVFGLQCTTTNSTSLFGSAVQTSESFSYTCSPGNEFVDIFWRSEGSYEGAVSFLNAGIRVDSPNVSNFTVNGNPAFYSSISRSDGSRRIVVETVSGSYTMSVYFDPLSSWPSGLPPKDTVTRLLSASLGSPTTLQSFSPIGTLGGPGYGQTLTYVAVGAVAVVAVVAVAALRMRSKGGSHVASKLLRGKADSRSSPGGMTGFCTTCGAPIVRESKFCDNCGNPVA